MKKYADRYFQIHPWRVEEVGFDPAYAQVSESVFSLGNEYTGLRGYFDEGYSGSSLQGSYLNGIYERRMLTPSGYKGMLPYTEFMVNTVDWVYTRIVCNGQALDLAKVKFTDFKRVLDLRTGLLCREFVWQVDQATQVKLSFERFTSMEQEQFCGQKLRVEALSGTAVLSICGGLDFSRPHSALKRSAFRVDALDADGTGCAIRATTEHTRQTVCAYARFWGMEGKPVTVGEAVAANEFHAELKAGETCELRRVVTLICARDQEEQATLETRAEAGKAALVRQDYEALKEGSIRWWSDQWKVSDIEINGDEANQQGIRFCVFQLHQTLHTAKYGAVFGAKGLTGEAYNGNTFWDSEVYCLPFYLFNNPDAAKSFLKFRYNTLPQAMERAKALDCKGAFYPIATISGKECCDLWQHASLQLQASTGVAYGLWNYVRQTGDRDFLFQYGVPMLVEISRMLASRGDFDPVTGQYGYYCVMGPDEFQMMVHHNAYTNFMGKKALEFTLDALAQMAQERPEAYAGLELKEEELSDWKNKAERMYLPYDPDTQLFEQHMGYFHLPSADISAIPTAEFPLYSHWSYDRIYRNDMIKQPDVLMFFLLYGSDFTRKQLEVNFDFYEPRCIHESSLSPSTHSILACQLGRMEKAEELFDFATRMDLDNYNRNTSEGLHTTSIAGAWMNIVYGFGGLRSDTERLTLEPRIPAGWKSYTFSLRCGRSILRVRVDQKEVVISCAEGGPVALSLYGKELLVQEEPVRCPLGGEG